MCFLFIGSFHDLKTKYFVTKVIFIKSLKLYFHLKFIIMVAQNIALYSWTNGIIMIAIFGIVCLSLIGFLIAFMMGGKKKEDSEKY